MSKVVHLSDQAHTKAKAYCQLRGLKMSEWVAALIDRATEDAASSSPLAPPEMIPGAIGEISQGTGSSSPNLRSREVASNEVNAYQALVQKKKLPSAVAGVQNMADNSTPIYEAPPFWAR